MNIKVLGHSETVTSRQRLALEINQTVGTLQQLIAQQSLEFRQLRQQFKEEINKRKLLEKKLQTSEAKIRATFEAMTDIILVLTLEDNQLKDLEILPTNITCLGKNGTDLISHTVEQFFQNETATIWLKKVKQALDTQETSNFDYSLSWKNHEFWFTARISPISEDSVIWVARDISDRKQAELELERTKTALEQQNQRLQHEIYVRERAEQDILFLVSITQAIAEADDFQSALSIILRYCCETIGWDFGEAWIPNKDTNLLECSQSWYTNDSNLEIFKDPSFLVNLASNQGLAGRVWSSQQPLWIEDVSVESPQFFGRSKLTANLGLKAGFGVPILFNNQVLTILVFFNKIASPQQRYWVELVNAVAAQLGSLIQRKQAQEALKIAEENYHSIVENAVDGICQSTPSGQFLSANLALARIYGYNSPDELMNSICNIPHQLYIDKKHYQEFVTAIQANNEVKGFESLVYRKDGTAIWISENARAVRDLEGKLLYYEGTVSDVTQRKLMEEALKFEQEQLEALLLNILPAPISKRLQKGENPIAERFEEVSVLFADLVGFTEFSSRKTPEELVLILNAIFSEFDQLAQAYGLEKIKTIGDAYMVVGGLPTFRPDHAEAVAQMALSMQTAITQINAQIGETFKLRIGINTGPVVAGVIGLNKFIYDLWGDTVNTASRMEANGIPGEIQVTMATYEQLKRQFLFAERGHIPIKGKGEMITYLLQGQKPVQHRVNR